MALRLDSQTYAGGPALGLDAQTYAAVQSTNQLSDCEILIIPLGTQAFAQGPAQTSQTGSVTLTLTPAGAQSFSPADIQSSTQVGSVTLIVQALGEQSFVSSPQSSVQEGAVQIALTPIGYQSYTSIESFDIYGISFDFRAAGLNKTVPPDPIIDERTTAFMKVSFRNVDGAYVAPSGISYRVDCMTTGQAVRAVTPLTPDQYVRIKLTPTDNAMRIQSNTSELRRVTILASFGTSDEVNAQFDYRIRNLSGVS